MSCQNLSFEFCCYLSWVLLLFEFCHNLSFEFCHNFSFIGEESLSLKKVCWAKKNVGGHFSLVKFCLFVEKTSFWEKNFLVKKKILVEKVCVGKSFVFITVFWWRNFFLLKEKKLWKMFLEKEEKNVMIFFGGWNFFWWRRNTFGEMSFF